MLLGGLAHTAGLLRLSRRETFDHAEGPPADAVSAGDRPRPIRQVLVLLGAIVVVVIGAELLVEGATSSARSLGVSDASIGLKIVAVGTSAPELVTTIVSTVRGERDLAIGNLIGSSIYNISPVLAPTVLIAAPRRSGTRRSARRRPRAARGGDRGRRTGFRLWFAISRLEGGLFVATYTGYLTWLLLIRT
jgi:cation:H+ antiporter